MAVIGTVDPEPARETESRESRDLTSISESRIKKIQLSLGCTYQVKVAAQDPAAQLSGDQWR